MIDLKVLGERFRLLRSHVGLTQKGLAAATGLSQTVISRLENGEEVYASALLCVFRFYQNRVSLDDLLSPDFNLDALRLYQHRKETQQLLQRHLDIIKDILTSANESSLQQLDYLMQKVSE